MSYLGDYAEDYADLNFKFTTRRFSTGAPHALSGGTISVYKSNDTTQSTAGVTLTADFDGVTGLNNVKIDLSADAFYATGKDYQVIITAGTVDSVSVAGECVASFSIENRFQEVDVVKWLGTAAATPTVAGVPEVDVTHLGGGAQSAADLKDFADDGYDPATHALANDPGGVTTLLSRLSSTRAGYLDNLSAGAVALASQILDAAGIRTAVGLASANLDTQIGLLATAAKLLKYVQLLARKDGAIATDNATELTAINANGGSGAGAFANTTDSAEAIRDLTADVKTDTAAAKLVTDKLDTVLELIP